MTTPLAPETPDADTFGGVFDNADAVVDPETELDASYFNRLLAQVVMLSHTAARAWARVTAGAAPVVADHDAVWGTGASVAPTVVRSAVGVYTVSWASAYDDLQATPESHSVSLRACQGGVAHAGAARIHNESLASANTATIRCYDAAGAAADVDEFTLWVW